MNLLRGTAAFAAWSWNVIALFLTLRRFTTIATILSQVVALVTNVAAFILPLKIIMVAATPGAPSFAPFITEDTKMAWVAGLSIAAILLYVATLVLEATARMLSADGSAEVVVRANSLPLVANHKEEAAGLFARFCQIVAYAVFSLAGFFTLAAINTPVFFYLLAFCIVSYFATAWLTRRPRHLQKHFMEKFVDENLGQYLKILSSAGFLTAFLVVLYPFLLSEDANVLIGIISIMLIRRVFPVMVSLAGNAFKLQNRRAFIDAILFPQYRLPATIDERRSTLIELLGGQRRQKIIAEHLDNEFNPGGKLKVSWLDPVINGVSMLRVRGSGAGATGARYLVKIYPRSHIHLCESERFLFSRIDRNRLFAPRYIKEFDHGQFRFEVLDYGQGKFATPRGWSKLEPLILDRVWSIEPPAELVEAYRQSHALLGDRLTSDLVERIKIAADTRPQLQALARFQEGLPQMREKIAASPLLVFNPDIDLAATAIAADAQPIVTSWARWRLEPIGADIRARTRPEEVERRLSLARQLRSDIRDDFTPERAYLVRHCQLLVHLVSQKKYGAALSLILQDLADESGEKEVRQEAELPRLGDSLP